MVRIGQPDQVVERLEHRCRTGQRPPVGGPQAVQQQREIASPELLLRHTHDERDSRHREDRTGVLGPDVGSDHSRGLGLGEQLPHRDHDLRPVPPGIVDAQGVLRIDHNLPGRPRQHLGGQRTSTVGAVDDGSAEVSLIRSAPRPSPCGGLVSASVGQHRSGGSTSVCAASNRWAPSNVANDRVVLSACRVSVASRLLAGCRRCLVGADLTAPSPETKGSRPWPDS